MQGWIRSRHGSASPIGICGVHSAAEFGVSPVQFAQTQRLLLAKRLLTDTALPIADVAFASGFGSVRRFNALFQAALSAEARTIAYLSTCVAVRERHGGYARCSN